MNQNNQIKINTNKTGTLDDIISFPDFSDTNDSLLNLFFCLSKSNTFGFEEITEYILPIC